MQALNDALEREKEIVRQKNEQLDIQAGDWVSGASQGFNNWLDDTKDISEQIKSTTTQMFDGMTDALGDFVTTGKANFRSFATSVISDLSRIALKASITGIFDSISNSSSGGILGTIGSAISKFIPNAKGGVYESPSLSTYSNGIYDSPQFFAFAKGAGVFGEAGPEVVTPLRDFERMMGMDQGSARPIQVAGKTVAWLQDLVDGRAEIVVAGAFNTADQYGRQYK